MKRIKPLNLIVLSMLIIESIALLGSITCKASTPSFTELFSEKRLNKEAENTEMYKFIQSHPKQEMQCITVALPDNKTFPSGMVYGDNKQYIYLVGTSAQLNKAINRLNNFKPNEKIILLNNTENIAIFNEKLNRINDVSTLYENGEKVIVNNKKFSSNEVQKIIKKTVESNPLFDFNNSYSGV